MPMYVDACGRESDLLLAAGFLSYLFSQTSHRQSVFLPVQQLLCDCFFFFNTSEGRRQSQFLIEEVTGLTSISGKPNQYPIWSI